MPSHHQTEAPLAEREQSPEYPPKLEWELLPNGLNKWNHILTDLPPYVFTAFEYVPPRYERESSRFTGIDPYIAGNGERIYDVGIDPMALGELAAGTYVAKSEEYHAYAIKIIEDESGDKYFDFSKKPLDLTFAQMYVKEAEYKPPEVREAYQNGAYFSVLADNSRNMKEGDSAFTITPIAMLMYQKLGFKKIDENGEPRLLFPTPQTLMRHAEAMGLPVNFIDRRQINRASSPVDVYQQSFAAGKYPIGVTDLAYYLHDITNDHFGGAMFGYVSDNGEAYQGETLLSLFAPLVQKVNALGMDRADLLDKLTVKVNAVLGVLREEKDSSTKKRGMWRDMSATKDTYQSTIKDITKEVWDFYETLTIETHGYPDTKEEVKVNSALYRLFAWQARQLSDAPHVMQRAEWLDSQSDALMKPIKKAGRIAVHSGSSDNR